MNIDTLNAYCGIELVSVPYPAQGRLNIHQTIVCLLRAAVLRVAGQSFMICRADFMDSTLGSDPGLLPVAVCTPCRTLRLSAKH